MSDFKYNIGDELYTRHWGSIEHVKIIEQHDKKGLLTANQNYYTVELIKYSNLTTSCLENKLFVTEADLLDTERTEAEALYNSYISEINGVEDLAVFCFTHDVYSDDCDDIAVRAAKAKFEEYGISIPR